MRARPEQDLPVRPTEYSVNERFKRGDRRRFILSMTAAALAHLLVLAIDPDWEPTMEIGAYVPPAAMQSITLVPEIAMPSRPAPITAPAVPIVARLELAEDITVDPVEGLGEPPPLPAVPDPPVTAVRERELMRYEYFAPYMVRPELLNRDEVRRVLERRYPNVLRRSHVEGAVLVVFWIDETGTVQKYEIRKSSGSKELDRAVEDVIEIMKFRPAMERGEPVKVIVALPIRFQVF